jgi:hypothetical protein
MMNRLIQRIAAPAAIAVTLAGLPQAQAAEPRGLLETIHHHVTLGSMVTDNGDLNPYAVVVVPESVGLLHKDDVLVDNFNNISNLQGTGGTIVAYSPSTKKTTLFARVPQHLPQCPGGVGLTTAMAVLKSGWVIVGSTPSTDGTTSTRGDGCLLVFDAQGQLATTWTGPNINGPWGNMAWTDNGSQASLFISMSGFDVPGPDKIDPATGLPVTLNKATVLRLNLSIPAGKPPVIASQTVIADGFSHRADRDVFLIGPTGVALGSNGTLYVADTLANRIMAIPDAATRTSSAGTGQLITQGQLLQRPLALAMTSMGHLIACNGKNGQVVEIDPVSGKQLYAQWVDANQAQSPPGNGDLFGIAMRPDGKGFYYVEDEVNFLVEATP